MQLMRPRHIEEKQNDWNTSCSCGKNILYFIMCGTIRCLTLRLVPLLRLDCTQANLATMHTAYTPASIASQTEGICSISEPTLSW